MFLKETNNDVEPHGSIVPDQMPILSLSLLVTCILALFPGSLALADPPNGNEYWSSDFFRQGIFGGVSAMTVHDGHLVLAGDFLAAGGLAAGGIAAWDGNTWRDLGGGESLHRVAQQIDIVVDAGIQYIHSRRA